MAHRYHQGYYVNHPNGRYRVEEATSSSGWIDNNGHRGVGPFRRIWRNPIIKLGGKALVGLIGLGIGVAGISKLYRYFQAKKAEQARIAQDKLNANRMSIGLNKPSGADMVSVNKTEYEQAKEFAQNRAQNKK
jgi:hypothetical protein